MEEESLPSDGQGLIFIQDSLSVEVRLETDMGSLFDIMHLLHN
ncbi:hypothetical protein [Virgibacillus halodenitrificans]